VAVVWSKLTN